MLPTGEGGCPCTPPTCSNVSPSVIQCCCSKESTRGFSHGSRLCFVRHKPVCNLASSYINTKLHNLIRSAIVNYCTRCDATAGFVVRLTLGRKVDVREEGNAVVVTCQEVLPHQMCQSCFLKIVLNPVEAVPSVLWAAYRGKHNLSK